VLTLHKAIDGDVEGEPMHREVRDLADNTTRGVPSHRFADSFEVLAGRSTVVDHLIAEGGTS
jgi:hypothetical protein